MQPDPSPQTAVSSAERLEEMRERWQWRWSWWVGKGAVALAILASLALAATVLLAQRVLAGKGFQASTDVLRQMMGLDDL